ncbi:MAG: DUF4249 family protein [Bacteroidetes bacterium]|nr:DUF4249 family protein [Bacteroidota bacterium]
MKKYILFIFLLITGIFLISCEKKAKNPEFIDYAVVEAYLHNGSFLKVSIGRQIMYSSDAFYSADNLDSLVLTLVAGDSTYILKPVGDGVYIDSTHFIEEGVTYTLSFSFNDQLVTASTTIPSKPTNYTQSATTISVPDMSSGGIPSGMPEPVELSWDNSDQSYYMVVIENIEDNPTGIHEEGDDGPPPQVFRNAPMQNSSYMLSPMSFWYYGTHRLILFHMNPEYAALYDENGNTSQNICTPSQTIQNGLGIFTGINSDTLWIEVTSK